LTKYLFEKICGDEIANIFYYVSIKLNSLNLTSKELALILPVALTLPGCSNFKKFNHLSKSYILSIDSNFIDKNRISCFHSKYSNLLVNVLLEKKRDPRFYHELKEASNLDSNLHFLSFLLFYRFSSLSQLLDSFRKK
jgi:hypothetical protein